MVVKLMRRVYDFWSLVCAQTRVHLYNPVLWRTLLTKSGMTRLISETVSRCEQDSLTNQCLNMNLVLGHLQLYTSQLPIQCEGASSVNQFPGLNRHEALTLSLYYLPQSFCNSSFSLYKRKGVWEMWKRVMHGSLYWKYLVYCLVRKGLGCSVISNEGGHKKIATLLSRLEIPKAALSLGGFFGVWRPIPTLNSTNVLFGAVNTWHNHE